MGDGEWVLELGGGEEKSRHLGGSALMGGGVCPAWPSHSGFRKVLFFPGPCPPSQRQMRLCWAQGLESCWARGTKLNPSPILGKWGEETGPQSQLLPALSVTAVCHSREPPLYSPLPARSRAAWYTGFQQLIASELGLGCAG